MKFFSAALLFSFLTGTLFWGCKDSSGKAAQATQIYNEVYQTVKHYNSDPTRSLAIFDSLETKAAALGIDSLVQYVRGRKLGVYVVLNQNDKVDSVFRLAIARRYDDDAYRRAFVYGQYAYKFVTYTPQTDSAMFYANQSDSLLQHCNSEGVYKLKIMNILSRQAVYEKTDQVGKRSRELQEALKLAEANRDSLNQIITLLHCTELTNEQRNLEGTEAYLLRLLNLSHDETSIMYLAGMQNLADAYFEGNAYAKAQHYLQEVRKLIEKHKVAHQPLKVDNHFTQANLYARKNDLKQGEHYYLSALQIADSCKYYEASLQICATLADFYSQQQRMPEAQAYAERALKLLPAYPTSVNNKEKIFRALSRYYRRQGNAAAAYAYQDSMDVAKDSVYSRERFVTRAVLHEQYEAEKKDAQIAKKQAELSRLQLQHTLVVSLAALLLIVFAFTIYVMRQKLKVQKRLIAKNQELADMTIKIMEPEELKLSQTICDASSATLTPATVAQDVTASSDNDVSMTIKKMDEIVDKLRHAMNEERIYMDETLTLDLLATHLCTNRSYLSSVINKKFGKSFSEYINFYRVQAAKELLRTTENKVLDIGKKVGFNSTQSFYSAFKSQTDVSPSVFRRLNKA